MAPARKITAATGKSIFDRQPKPKPLRTPKPTNLSAEIVQDSDSEPEAQVPTPISKTTTKSTKIQSPAKGQLSDSTSSSEATNDSDADTSESTTNKLAAVNGTGKPTPSSPKVNGLKRKTTASSDSDDESSSSEDEPASPSKKQRVHDTTSSETSEDESSSDEEEGNSSSNNAKTTTVTNSSSTPNIPHPTSATTSSRQKSIPPREYLPPEGYRSLNTTAAAVLSLNDIQDKVVWHISAPSDVPIASVTSITLEGIKRGDIILTHEGTRYTLKEEQNGDATVLLPGTKGYERGGQAVSIMLSLCPVLDLPVISSNAATRNAGSQAAANVATAAVTSIKPQPKGLRMRYKPPGSGAQGLGLIGDSSSDDEASQPLNKASKSKASFQFPTTLGGHTDDTPDGLSSIVPSEKQVKKSKKHKKQQTEAEKLDTLQQDAEPIPKPARPSNTLKSITNATQTQAKDKSKTPAEDDDEARARRKAEKKKLKKLAKLKAQGLES